MKQICKFLFPAAPQSAGSSWLILAFRLIFGLLLMSHGWQKICNFQAMSEVFPDPIGMGSSVSLSLAIFAEFFCALAFVFGFLYRLCMIPMVFTMCIAFFVVHGQDPFAVKELAFVYLAAFVALYFSGPGKYALDHLIRQKCA